MPFLISYEVSNFGYVDSIPNKILPEYRFPAHINVRMFFYNISSVEFDVDVYQADSVDTQHQLVQRVDFQIGNRLDDEEETESGHAHVHYIH